jgi:uncharacterized membrane protein YozB (DUF420 family)
MQPKQNSTANNPFTFAAVLHFVFWSFIVVATSYFLWSNVGKFFIKGVPEHYGSTLMDRRLWLYLHIAGGVVVLLLGPLQFWKRFRTANMRLHRIAGKLYIIGSLLATVCLIRLLPYSECRDCIPSQTVVTSLWFLSTIAAWWTIKRKNVKAHKQFMARSYLFAFYFVAIRLIDKVGANFADSLTIDSGLFANTDWFAWVVPLLFLEMYQSWWPVAKVNYTTKQGKVAQTN